MRPSPHSRRAARLPAGVALGLAVLIALAAPRAQADGAGFEVIVNAANPITALSHDALTDLFLKKVTRWDTGELARPVDLPADADVRRAFSNGVLLRPISVVRAYWEQRIFSGRDVPPPELDSDDAVVRYVARYPGAVGYVSTHARLDGVKILAVR